MSPSPPFNLILFDTATAAEKQEEAIRLDPSRQSFYKGTSEENKKAAPYLFELKPETDFANWYFKNGWNQSWGVPLFSSGTFEETYRHFRKFLIVKTEEGKQMYFRFYDPRVLRIFLPTCDRSQILEFFGPVKIFICEDEDPEHILLFSHQNGELVTDRRKASLILNEIEIK